MVMAQKNLTKAVKDVTHEPRGLQKKIWTSKEKIDPEVRDSLIKIATNVWKDMGQEVKKIEDIVFTGSLTGNHWTPDSDIDLHIIVQFSDIDDNEELIEEYFRARTRIWNNSHDIKIEGYPVEIYIQDVDQEHHSARVYSLLSDTWVVNNPEGKYAKFSEVSKKAKVLAQDINNAIENLKEPTQQHFDAASKIMDKMRKMRTVGLEKAGEGSVENLAYKALRRAGFFEKLNDSLIKTFDQLYSDS